MRIKNTPKYMWKGTKRGLISNYYYSNKYRPALYALRTSCQMALCHLIRHCSRLKYTSQSDVLILNI